MPLLFSGGGATAAQGCGLCSGVSAVGLQVGTGRTRRTGVLAVLLPSQMEAMPTPTLAGAAAAAHEAGHFMEISVVDGTAQDRAARASELLNSGRVDGVLSLTALPGLQDRAAGPDSAAFTAWDQFDDALRGIGPLADASPMAEIVRSLAADGHRHLLHVAGPPDWTSARARRQVFEETTTELGLDSADVTGGGWGAEVGRTAVLGLPEDTSVTGVVAANDQVALGAMRGAYERGWAVPERLSVVGWDDSEAGQYAVPALSTVAVDRHGQGRQAMDRLIALVKGQRTPTAQPDPNRLILRESTGPAPALPHD